MCQLCVAPTPIASAPAASGPITGTISTTPAKEPISSQYGRPIAKKPAESSTATNAISTSWPRTNAPSFWSISTHVSRVTRRCFGGTIDCTRPIVRSRSKIQYAPTANMKKMPTSTSNAVFVTSSAGWTIFVAARQPAQPLVETGEDVVLDPGRVRRLLVDRRGRRRLLHLVDCPRHEDPEHEGHDSGDREVVDEDAHASRAAARAAGATRCSAASPRR